LSALADLDLDSLGLPDREFWLSGLADRDLAPFGMAAFSELGDLDLKLPAGLGDLDLKLPAGLGDLDLTLLAELGDLDLKLPAGLGDLDLTLLAGLGDLDLELSRLADLEREESGERGFNVAASSAAITYYAILTHHKMPQRRFFRIKLGFPTLVRVPSKTFDRSNPGIGHLAVLAYLCCI
jgi:hypothetical protein